MNWLNSFTVGHKLIAGFLIVAALGALTGTHGVLKSSELNDLASQMYERETVGLRHTAEANMHLLAVGRHVRSAILATTPDERVQQLRVVDKVDAGSLLVGAAGATMDDIVTQVQQVTQLINAISAATSEQTTGIGQVSAAVSQLDQVTQQNAALVEESAAATASLSQQAQKLVRAVGVFRLHGSV